MTTKVPDWNMRRQAEVEIRARLDRTVPYYLPQWLKRYEGALAQLFAAQEELSPLMSSHGYFPELQAVEDAILTLREKLEETTAEWESRNKSKLTAGIRE